MKLINKLLKLLKTPQIDLLIVPLIFLIFEKNMKVKTNKNN